MGASPVATMSVISIEPKVPHNANPEGAGVVDQYAASDRTPPPLVDTLLMSDDSAEVGQCVRLDDVAASASTQIAGGSTLSTGHTIGPPQAAPNANLCCGYPGCGRTFSTANGRGQHERRTHMEWKSNRDMGSQANRAKKSWDDSERRALAKAEIRAIKADEAASAQGVKLTRLGMNERLAEIHPLVTSIQVKNCRRTQAYKEIFDQLLGETFPVCIAGQGDPTLLEDEARILDAELQLIREHGLELCSKNHFGLNKKIQSAVSMLHNITLSLGDVKKIRQRKGYVRRRVAAITDLSRDDSSLTGPMVGPISPAPDPGAGRNLALSHENNISRETINLVGNTQEGNTEAYSETYLQETAGRGDDSVEVVVIDEGLISDGPSGVSGLEDENLDSNDTDTCPLAVDNAILEADESAVWYDAERSVVDVFSEGGVSEPEAELAVGPVRDVDGDAATLDLGLVPAEQGELMETPVAREGVEDTSANMTDQLYTSRMGAEVEDALGQLPLSNTTDDSVIQDPTHLVSVEREIHESCLKRELSKYQLMLGEIWDGESPTGIVADLTAIDDWVKEFVRSRVLVKFSIKQRHENANKRVSVPLVRGKEESRKHFAMRRMRYIRMMFEKDPFRCGKELQNNLIGAASNNVEAAELLEDWKVRLTRSSQRIGGKLDLPPIHPTNHQLDGPISKEEIKMALKKMNNSSPGPDGIKLEHVKRVDMDELRTLFLVFQASAWSPTWMRRARVTLIPKKPIPQSSSDFRPIAVNSHLIRLYHSVVNQRLQAIPLSQNQKGFVAEDGCAQNLWIIKSLIKDAKTRRKPMTLVFLDVAKAFDSVDHEMLISTAERLGVPPRMLNYIRGTLADAEFQLRGSKEYHRKRCGVNQGDPPSGTLFNFCSEVVYSSLDLELGYRMENGELITNGLLADDAFLVSSSVAGAQELLTEVVDNLAAMGLQVNPSKCVALTVGVLGKEKRTYVDTRKILKIRDELLPMLEVEGTYKYLGLDVGYLGFQVERNRLKFRESLDRIQDSPLKPQHKLFLLRHQVIPAQFYWMVLADLSLNVLRQCDVEVRRMVRKVCHIPHDVPTAMFHADVKDGGLGLPSFETRCRRLRRDRVCSMQNASDPIVRACLSASYSASVLSRVNQPHHKGGIEILSKRDEREAWANCLSRTVDGCGLVHLSQTELPCSAWLVDPAMRLAGKEFLKALHVRLNCLKTPSRESRGRPLMSSRCKHDRQPGTMNHISQKCPITHGYRVKRHDEIVSRIRRRCINLGYRVYKEPRIGGSGSRGFLKPDLVLFSPDKPGVVYVLDPQVVGDQVDLPGRYMDKQAKYDKEEITNWCREKCGDPEAEVKVGGLIYSFRGALDNLSGRFLKILKLGRLFREYLTVSMLVNTWHIWNMYLCAT